MLDMTHWVDWAVKPQHKQTGKVNHYNSVSDVMCCCVVPKSNVKEKLTTTRMFLMSSVVMLSQTLMHRKK